MFDLLLIGGQMLYEYFSNKAERARDEAEARAAQRKADQIARIVWNITKSQNNIDKLKEHADNLAIFANMVPNSGAVDKINQAIKVGQDAINMGNKANVSMSDEQRNMVEATTEHANKILDEQLNAPVINDTPTGVETNQLHTLTNEGENNGKRI